MKQHSLQKTVCEDNVYLLSVQSVADENKVLPLI